MLGKNTRRRFTLLFAWMCYGAKAASANQPPIADAGVDRYLDAQALTLDGGGSHDPDPGNTIVSYQWTQLSGPALSIANANTATPTVAATPTSTIGTSILQLVVSDGQTSSAPDTIKLTIVQAVPVSIQLTLENPPFDVNKPTAVFFNGGNCSTGGGAWGLGAEWEAAANIISFVYGPPYDRPADALIAYLSRVAPNYSRPIQTSGWSTGGMPAMDSAIRLNKVFADPRYGVGIVNLLDAACRNYDASIVDFITHPLGDKGAWIQNVYSTTAGSGTFRARAINIAIEGPHEYPPLYYLNSIYPELFSTDVYNHGLVGGAFLSVFQYGPNYRVPNLSNSPYYFHIVVEGSGETIHLEPFNSTSFPGRLPQPISLNGPDDGSIAPVTGVSFSCTASENSVAYDFLFGMSPSQLAIKLSAASPPSITTGALPPGQTYYWALQVRDVLGTTFRADVRSMSIASGLKVDVNGDGQVDGADCAIIQSAFGTMWGNPAFQLAADYNNDGKIDCFDHLAWLADYRAYYADVTRPDPCGPASSSDQDSDGVVDLCDACPDTAIGRVVGSNGCPLPIRVILTTMATWINRISAGFRRAWAFATRPTMTAVRPTLT